MSPRTAIIASFCIALGLCLWSLRELPVVWPLFTDSAVRKAVPVAMQDLRNRGIWLVDTELKGIGKGQGQGAICFQWSHVYHGRLQQSAPEALTTCVPNT